MSSDQTTEQNSYATIASQVVDKLNADAMSWIKYGATEIAGLQALVDTVRAESKESKRSVKLNKLPKAFVWASGALAGKAKTTTRSLTQERTRRVTIAFAISVVNDGEGTKAKASAEELADKTTDLMLGHTLTGFSPFVLSRNAEQLIAWQNNLLIYAVNIETTKSICKRGVTTL